MSQFNILGRSIEFPENVDRYAMLRNDKVAMQLKCIQQYRVTYNSYGKIETVLAKYKNDVNDIVSDVGKELYKNLVKLEIYDLSIDTYLSLYTGSHEDAANAFEDIYDQYEDIVLAEEEKDAARTARRQNRSRVSGGGFGLEGAVKGMATAGALNMASGVLHGTANLIGKGISTVSAKMALSSLYKSKETLDVLLCGIYDTIEEVYDGYMACLNEKVEKNYFYNPFDYDKAKALFANAKNPELKDKEAELLIQALQQNPTNQEIYQYIIDQYDDEKNEAELMANFFNRQWDVKAYKLSFIEKQFVSSHFDSEDDLRKEKDDITAYCKRFGVDPIAYSNVIDRILDKHDVTYRTVDGNLYETREEADTAKSEVKTFVNLTQGLNTNDEGKLIEIKNSLIENIKMSSKDRYINFIDRNLEDYDLRYRTVRNDVYTSRELADKARYEIKEIGKIIGDIDYSSIESIQKAIDDITETYELDVKNIYLQKLNEGVDVWNKAIEYLNRYKDYQFEKRIELSYCIYDGINIKEECEALGILPLDFMNWLDNLILKFSTIDGQYFESLAEANRKYYKMIDHANSYLKYITEKNAEKKSFFSNLKNNVKGVFVKGHEDDYNYITQNGSQPIPNDLPEEGKQIITEDKVRKETIVELRANYVEKYKEIELGIEIPEVIVHGASIINVTNPVDMEEIYDMVNEVCTTIQIEKSSKNSKGKKECKKDEEVADVISEMVTDSASDTVPESASESVANKVLIKSSDNSVELNYGNTAKEENSNQDAGHYRLVLMKVGANSVGVIKLVREVTGLGLTESKELVDSAPNSIITVYSLNDAKIITARFESIGATVEIENSLTF